MNKESLVTEFKREYTDDIVKTVIAFANTNGGELLIGIDDNGSITGVDNTDTTMLKVANTIRDSIRPDVTLFTLCEARTIKGKSIIAINVQKGTAPPYYLPGKGIRPEGVFVRQGASTVPATESAILKMIKETGGDSFETTRSLKQELTFHSAGKFFAEEKIKFGNEQKRTLCLIGEDGAFTNLALLLSDQCMHTTKLAVFEGNSKLVFKDRVEFSGSLLKQLEDIYEYINRFNRTRAEFSGLKRIDLRDYPPEAVREALLNALVHRDYSYSDSTFISVFDNRIEFVSLGGLPKGISFSDMMLGVSVLRNSHLADVFYRLHLIEAFGTGMPKIMECYREHEDQPNIELSDNAFKITLPNTNYQQDVSYKKDALTTAEKRILNYLSAHKTVARIDLETALGLSQSVTIRTLKKLLDNNLIRRIGKGKSIRYSTTKRK